MDQRTTFSSPNSHFESRPEGLFAIDHEGKETPICDAIRHIGNAARADSGGAADIVEFRDRTGVLREAVLLHKDSVLNTRKMLESLADQNFAVPEPKAEREQLVSYLAECRRSPKHTFLLVQRMGWHGDSFVIGNDVITTAGAVGVRLDGPLSREVEKFGQNGSLFDYQKKILRRAKYSSRLMAGVALALLAPLARIIGLENGGINIVGAAGIGKTTILRIIGSFYGGGPVPYIEPWLMTDNAPETLGFAHCDLPLLLDELDALEPDAEKAGGRLKTIVHRLVLGQGKNISHRARTKDQGLRDFHVIFASTSEHRLPDFMREGGSKVTGGQLARFIDIPADAGQGRQIFEGLPKIRGKRIKPEHYLRILNRDCKNYYGVAGREYLRCLVQHWRASPHELKEFLNKEAAAFETYVGADHVDPRVRRRFAGLYAAGQLGLRYKVLPPECDGFMAAIASCYRDAIALIPRPLLSTPRAIDTLGKFLDDNRKRLLKVEGLKRSAWEDAVGLRRTSGRHGKCIWLKRDIFPEIFPSEHGSAAKLLAAAGVIARSTTGIARQERLPGLETREYFYIIDWTELDAARQKTEDR
jgi:putative DNA primase/helicase